MGWPSLGSIDLGTAIRGSCLSLVARSACVRGESPTVLGSASYGKGDDAGRLSVRASRKRCVRVAFLRSENGDHPQDSRMPDDYNAGSRLMHGLHKCT